MKRWGILLAFAVAIAWVGFASDRELVLARRNAPPASTIVFAANADETVRYAANELQTFVSRLTGVMLPISTNLVAAGQVIRLDNRSKGDVRLDCEDAFRLKSKGGCLLVRGGGSRGVLYGVYELLERFGACAWFAPGCETIPGLETLSVPADLDIVERPAFLQRETSWRHNIRDDAFAARLRFDGQWHDKSPYGGTAFPFVKRLGLCHTFERLVPPDKWFAAHPEWFSEIKGRRLGEKSQLCCSNGELVKFVVQEIHARLNAEPAARFVGVSQNDWGNYCQCSNCEALAKAEGSQSGPFLRFVNAIAAEIEKDHPSVLVETLAYQYTRRPPKSIRPRSNVAVCLCSYECAFERPFAESDHPNTKRFCDDLRRWGEICPNLFIYNYAVNFRNYLYPFPNIRSMAPNYRLLMENGARWIYDQGDGNGYHGEFAELKCYLQSKLMWNPNRDVDALIDRFISAYYGKAAPLVRRYLNELYEAFGVGGVESPHPDASPTFSGIYGENLPWLDDARLLRWTKLWQEAEQAVRTDAQRLFNVRMSALPVLYIRLKRSYERGYKSVWVAGDVAPHQRAMKSLKPLAAELVRRADEANVRKQGFVLAESHARHRTLMKQFRELENWKAPECGDTVAEVGLDMMVKMGDSRNCLGLPIRLIACDSGSMYRVRARLRKKREVSLMCGQAEEHYGFAAGLHVDWLPRAEGTCRRTFPHSSVTDEWAWHDLGEYDFSALQKIPLPTMNGLCLFVQGDVDLDRLEIAKVRIDERFKSSRNYDVSKR